ncbi:MAG: glycoside hydrolase family 88 protein [Clostridia bacterium]|nr:glycoside hydrolase family 88 protein [Clostridia bacterium]
MNSLDYAKCACDTLMKKFEAKDLPLVGRFHYHQGVFLLGMYDVYKLTKNEKYLRYIDEWLLSNMNPDGSIIYYEADELDDMQPTSLLTELYAVNGDERYLTMPRCAMNHLKNWKTNEEGVFWHKDMFPNQMWLDGMYMAGPLMIRLGNLFGETSLYDTVYRQMRLFKEHNYDEETGLYYHAWDQSKKSRDFEPETGLTTCFWGRAIGWFVVAMFEIYELLPESYAHREEFFETGKNLVDALIPYADKNTGLWKQVIDKTERDDNWDEVSCSCLFVYAMSKMCTLKKMEEKYGECARKAYRGIIDTLTFNDDGIEINKVCVGTGLCDYKGYIERPTSTNDLHGVGAFLLMAAGYYNTFETDK